MLSDQQSHINNIIGKEIKKNKIKNGCAYHSTMTITSRRGKWWPNLGRASAGRSHGGVNTTTCLFKTNQFNGFDYRNKTTDPNVLLIVLLIINQNYQQ